ncbi:MAG: leucine-rich repeat protein [Ruminococcus sp.]|nr:leucine-rich repeat protein [Ruminococcus sp.]
MEIQKMKHITKTISLILALISVFAAFPFSVNAVVTDTKLTSYKKSGDFEYLILDNGTAEITDYYGNSTELIIPNSLEGYTVTIIGKYSFSWCKNLTSVTIPNTVQNIGSEAFSSCTSLTDVTIGNSVERIGSWAFGNCKNLASVTIGKNVKRIEENAFAFCESLNAIAIPDGTTSIDSGAFTSCTSLTSITIPDSVKSIGEFAFSDTAWYDNQPEGMVYAGKVAYECKGDLLETVVLKKDTVGIAGNAFAYCSNLKSITIPDSVINIGAGAFDDCTQMTNVTIGNGVKYIYDRAFYNCESLRSITIPDSVISIGYGAFYNCTNITSAIIGNGVISIAADAFYGCKKLVIATIGNSVISIGESAFLYCTNLKSITIPISVNFIGIRAFGYCYDSDNQIFKKIDNFTITGYSGAEAERYANSNGFGFISLGKVPEKTTITLKKSSDSIYVKGITQIKATVKNGNGKITYTSSDKKIAKVSSNGTITGVGKGTATITISNNGVSVKFKITVKKPLLNSTIRSMKKGTTFKLKITGKVGKAKFTSSNKKVVKVNSKGKVTAKKKGKATITVKTNGLKLKCTISVISKK